MNYDVEVKPNNDSKNIRINKGNSLISLVKDYVVFDIETTGLDARVDDIIEISAIKVMDDKIVDTFSSLVKPRVLISSFITSLTGITNEMVDTSPSIKEVLPLFLDFIGDFVLLGHNVNFDINFVYDNLVAMGISDGLKNDFVDTMRISRRILKNLNRHRLKDLAEYYKISYEGAHRSLVDCEITYNVYLKLKEQILSEFKDIETFLKYNSYNNYIKSSQIVPTNTEFDTENPFYQKNVAITGTLEKMTRKEAMQTIVDLGGIIEDSVTLNTHYLILGNNDYNYILKGKKSTKLKKAEQMKLDGYDIEIVPENIFYEMLEDLKERVDV